MGSSVLDTRVVDLRWKKTFTFENQMSFKNGDQLMLTVIYYGSTSKNELKYVHIYIGSLSYVEFSVHSGMTPGSHNLTLMLA